MHIREEQTNHIKLQRPEFICDSILHDQIPDPLERNHHFSAFIGRPGSGKTSLQTALLMTKKPKRIYRKVWHHIFYICPPHSRASMGDKKNPFRDLDPHNVYDELSVEALSEIREKCREYATEDENSLMIIDDCSAYLKNTDIQKLFCDLMFNKRHLRLSCHLLLQVWNNCPPCIRKVCTSVFLFKPSNKEFINVAEEMLNLDKHDAQILKNYVFQRPHDFLYIRTSDNTLYRNFNRLHLTDPEDESD